MDTLGDIMDNKFKKHDKEKVRLELIDPQFTWGLGEVLTFGAKKYGAHNWKKATTADKERMIGAIKRHLTQYELGKTTDEEDLSHLMCIACHIMFLHHIDIRDKVEEIKRRIGND